MCSLPLDIPPQPVLTTHQLPRLSPQCHTTLPTRPLSLARRPLLPLPERIQCARIPPGNSRRFLGSSPSKAPPAKLLQLASFKKHGSNCGDSFHRKFGSICQGMNQVWRLDWHQSAPSPVPAPRSQPSTPDHGAFGYPQYWHPRSHGSECVLFSQYQDSKTHTPPGGNSPFGFTFLTYKGDKIMCTSNPGQ